MYICGKDPQVLSGDQQNYWQQISKGDKTAYEKVFRAFYKDLCGYSCSLVKDPHEAEEVVQTVFYNLWLKRESLEISSLKSYLYRAVHNDGLNRLKHIKVRTSYANDIKHSGAGGSPDGAKLLESKETTKRIHEAIDSLPEQCGHVFRLSRFENKKYAEIAEELGISVKTVENHMGKALRLLRESLKEFLFCLVFILLQCGLL